MPGFDSYDLLFWLIALAAMYFVLGDMIDDVFRYLRKTWRRKLYGEQDFETRNVGFRLRINRKRFRRGVVGKGPTRFSRRSGSQLNPSGVQDPASASRAIRERD